MCHYKREQKNKKKTTKEQKNKRKQKRSKPLIAVLEEVKVSGIIFESHQRVSSV